MATIKGIGADTDRDEGLGVVRNTGRCVRKGNVVVSLQLVVSICLGVLDTALWAGERTVCCCEVRLKVSPCLLIVLTVARPIRT